MYQKLAIAQIGLIESLTGIERPFIFDEAYQLARRGIDVHVIRPKSEGSFLLHGIYHHGIQQKNPIQFIKMGLNNLQRCSPAILLRNPSKIYRENLYALNVSQVIEKNNIDLIHAHFAFPEGLIGLLAKTKTKKPLVVTVHGYDILVDQSISYGVRRTKKGDILVRKILNYADAIIARSRATFKEINCIVKDNKKVQLIYNGVDIARFNPNLNNCIIRKKLGIKERKIIFTLRQHEPKNGIEYLIRAAYIVTKENKDTIFVIGGDGSLKSFHEQLASKLGVEDKILFTGRISHNEVPYYYAMSDVIVVPSIQEAFGLVVSEAMACGKPVIGTRVGGITDQIIDGYNGFLVQSGNASEIAEKILWLINNSKAAQRMGKNGRRIVKEKFNINKKIDLIISLYETLLNKRS